MLVEQLEDEEDGKTFSSNIKNRRVCEVCNISTWKYK